jgi:hypothetical protein
LREGRHRRGSTRAGARPSVGQKEGEGQGEEVEEEVRAAGQGSEGRPSEKGSEGESGTAQEGRGERDAT